MKENVQFGAYAPGQVLNALIRLSQWTPVGRGKLRRRVADIVRDNHYGPLDTTLFGLNVRLSLHHNSSETKALLKPSLYSRTATALLQEHLSTDNAVIVDIGANVGVFSLLAASKMTFGSLVAIEPQPDLFARLSNHLGALNPRLAEQIDITLFNCAVGASNGAQTLNVPRQLGQASLRAIPDAKELNVPVRTIYDILTDAAVDHIDILKIDIEGFEDAALIPFFETAPDHVWPRAILLEHCLRDRWEQNVEAFLVQNGYRTKAKGRTDLVLVRT